MRKIMFYAAVCLAAAACSKGEKGCDPVEPAGPHRIATITGNVNSGETKLHSNPISIGDNVSFTWELNDSVFVSTDSGGGWFHLVPGSITSEGKSARFSGETLEGMDEGYNVQYNFFNDTLNYLENGFRPIAIGSGKAGSGFELEMQPVYRLQLKGEVNLGRIYYHALGDTGDTIVGLTLKCGDAGLALQRDKAADVYFPVKYESDNKATEHFSFYDENGNMLMSKKIAAGSGYSSPGVIYSMAQLTVVRHYCENDIDCGPGIGIGEIIWAPVNCGYDAKYYPYGKLYQWGRKHGSGYKASTLSDEGDVIQTAVSGPVDKADEKETEFYTVHSDKHDWLSPHDSTRWNGNKSWPEKESSPVKTEFDPCPYGWRVPTYGEFNALLGFIGISYRITKTGWDGTGDIKGRWFNGTDTPATGDGLFLPAAGNRGSFNGNAISRNSNGYYWSSSFDGSDVFTLGIMPNLYTIGISERTGGYSVRCVHDNRTDKR